MKHPKSPRPLVVAVALMCAAINPAFSAMSVQSESFGKLSDGQEVSRFTLTNSAGMTVKAMSYGGIITNLLVPDRSGKMADVVLGFDTLDDYLNQDSPYFGAIIGRYGNRIGKGKFSLDGKEFTLPQNNGENTLHGGLKGFDKRLWKATELKKDGEVGIVFTYTSAAGEEGFPGKLDVTVTYTLNEDNELTFAYEAKTDAPTVCNLTQHSYFNLAGHDSGDVLKHDLMLNAKFTTPVDAGLIPTGAIWEVAGSPFDFLKSKPIGQEIEARNQQIAFGGGYDHNWVLDKLAGEWGKAAEVHEPTSGRIMEVWTTEPAIQFYSGNFLDGTLNGKGGTKYKFRNGFCLETQHYPDSPNEPHFPSTRLNPGDVYKTKTTYKFSAK